MTPDRSRASRAIALALTAILVLPLVMLGCGGAKVDTNQYTVKQDGQNVGSQTVRIEEVSDGIVYDGTEKLPFAEFDTTRHRKLKVRKDLKAATSYEGSRRVPGATYTTYITPAPPETGDGFSYLADGLQTFSYVPLLSMGSRLIPLELDSAALMQALLDRFLNADVPQATAFVVIPSRGGTVYQVVISRPKQFVLSISGTGLPETQVEFAKDSFVKSVKSGGIAVEKGGTNLPASKAFQPIGKAGRTNAVRIITSEKLKNGDRLELAGSVYFPAKGAKPYKAVILVGDEGPQDRTGAGFLSQVADSLAGKGFLVLTCDRRGIPESQGSYARHTRETLLADLNTQVDYLVNRGDINTEKIAVAGYGEGGLLSLTIATVNPYVKRLALLAAPSMTLYPDLARVQVTEAQKAGDINEAEAALEQTQIDDVSKAVGSTDGETLRFMGHDVFLGWMRSWMKANVTQDIAGVKAPVLVLQGKADRDVPESQADQLMAALSGRPAGVQKLVKFDGLGHAFGKELTMGQSKPYREHPEVDPRVLDALGSWLNEM